MLDHMLYYCMGGKIYETWGNFFRAVDRDALACRMFRAADRWGTDAAERGEKAGGAKGAERGEKAGGAKDASAEDLEAALAAQPVRVTSAEYVVQDDKYKALYPDMLQAILQNDTQDDIRDAVVAFAAWDEHGLPVKIKGQFDFSDGNYVKKVDYDDINLAAGTSFGENGGFSLDESCKIKTVRAILVSYRTFDGKSWNNPHFKTFTALYVETKLKEGEGLS